MDVGIKDLEVQETKNNNNNNLFVRDNNNCFTNIVNKSACEVVVEEEDEEEQVKHAQNNTQSLLVPQAMLETIMPCEKICSNFRTITEEINNSGACLTTSSDTLLHHHQQHTTSPSKQQQFKQELCEPALASDGEQMHHHVQPTFCTSSEDAHFPLNLKSRVCVSEEKKHNTEVSLIFQIIKSLSQIMITSLNHQKQYKCLEIKESS